MTPSTTPSSPSQAAENLGLWEQDHLVTCIAGQIVFDQRHDTLQVEFPAIFAHPPDPTNLVTSFEGFDEDRYLNMDLLRERLKRPPRAAAEVMASGTPSIRAEKERRS